MTNRRVQQRRKAMAAAKGERVQRELKELQDATDLREIDDDIEELATLYEWEAPEHVHSPKTQRWFITLAVVAALMVAFFVISLNLIAAITIAFVAALTYGWAQRQPAVLRYRIMVDGVAIGQTLYQYEDLEAFNIVYEPDETKVALIRSNRPMAPLVAMEIGVADPNMIRDILLEFLDEDHDLKEPIADQLARRLGFSG